MRTETHDVIYQFDSVYPIEDRTILMECERYINNHMSDIHNVADLAIALRISERKLKDLFQEHTNLTAAGFIRERKISRSKELLSTTRMVMVDIAVELGYSNAANFATAFKHIEGITPSEYKLKSRSTPIF